MTSLIFAVVKVTSAEVVESDGLLVKPLPSSPRVPALIVGLELVMLTPLSVLLVPPITATAPALANVPSVKVVPLRSRADPALTVTDGDEFLELVTFSSSNTLMLLPIIVTSPALASAPPLVVVLLRLSIAADVPPMTLRVPAFLLG